jgi:hypothetical protein
MKLTIGVHRRTMEHLPVFLHAMVLNSLRTEEIIRKKLHGLSPQANYTNRATAACQRSQCQLFADRGCHVVSVTNPHGRILDFLDRIRYYCF